MLAELDNGILQSQVEVAAAAWPRPKRPAQQAVAGATPTELAAGPGRYRRRTGRGRPGAGHRQADPGSRRRRRDAGDHRPGAVQRAGQPTLDRRAGGGAAARSIWPGIALKQAQAAYDLVRGDPDIAARPESRRWSRPRPTTTRPQGGLPRRDPGRHAAAAWPSRRRRSMPRRRRRTVARGEVPPAEAGVEIRAGAGRARPGRARPPARPARRPKDRHGGCAVKSAQAALASAQAATDADPGRRAVRRAGRHDLSSAPASWPRRASRC